MSGPVLQRADDRGRADLGADRGLHRHHPEEEAEEGDIRQVSGVGFIILLFLLSLFTNTHSPASVYPNFYILLLKMFCFAKQQKQGVWN